MREKLYTLAFMVVVATVFTGAVAAVSALSRERVRLNQELARKRVVMRVLGIEAPADAALEAVAKAYEEQVKETGRYVEGPTGRHPILAGQAKGGEPLGYAFEIGGRGFWDMIRGYMALSADLRSIRGVSFFEQNETPGLGAEISKPWFEEQFNGKELPAEVPADGRFIRLVPKGAERGPHDVDAVTGATQTSDAVERILNDDLAAFLKAMAQQP